MTSSLVIELKWPAKELSPNSRVHHMVLARIKKAAREDANWSTRIALGIASGYTFGHDGASDIILNQIAHPPDKRDRDRDNLDHAMKAYRDGIADALGVNDKHFRPTGIQWGDPVRGGLIIITVGEPDAKRFGIEAAK